MKLYYTTSAGQDQVQTDPAKSLGGYRSATLLPNGKLHSIFGEISRYTISKDLEEYIGVILKNDNGADVTDIMIWFDVPDDSYSSYELAAVSLAADTDGVLAMERVGDRNSQPLVGVFVDATAEANKQNVGDIADTGMIGLWFKRTLETTQIQTDQDDLIYKETTADKVYIQRELNTSDEIGINIEWTQ